MINWHHINTAPMDVYVVVSCDSGYTTVPYTLRIAKYDGEDWRDECSDLLIEAGHKPIYWTHYKSVISHGDPKDSE